MPAMLIQRNQMQIWKEVMLMQEQEIKMEEMTVAQEPAVMQEQEAMLVLELVVPEQAVTVHPLHDRKNL